MNRTLFLLGFLFLLSSARAQSWQIEIRDNLSRMNMEQVYRIGPDSLVITGVADYGRSKVDYLRRTLSNKEIAALTSMLNTYPADSLKELYFDGYNNFKQIDADNYPRALELKIEKDGKLIVSKATNAWVALYVKLFEQVNPFLPAEVRITLDKSRFNVFY
ncbi:MAG: hypothetical protein JNL88_11810 [Bacteroidia bacterium]|nr:hypothetical protein [Bacteroidia bacterium]